MFEQPIHGRPNAHAERHLSGSFGAGGYGYAETAFEASPLNRPTAQSAPGATWRLGTATPRYQRFAWRSNTVADAVRDFTSNNSFAANALWMNEEIDENGRSRFSFTDKMGRTVLVRQPLNATETAQTYTVYDDFGRVACVIPPEATKRMAGSNNWDWTSATYASMVFKYTYDARGRMTAKTVPSAGTTAIAYDQLDRPVLTTDANGVKLFTRYDVLSRPVMTGRYVGSATGPNNTESLSETSNTVAPHYYTTTTFPAGTDAANTHVYKVLYYDDYDLDNNGSLGAGETYTNPAESGYDAAAFLRTRGKPTASKTAIIPNSPINSPTPPSSYLITRTYYDKEYAVIQVNKQNHLGGSDITSSAYDFANRLTKTRRDHTATPPGGTLQTHAIREEYVYDHAGRIRFVRHKINANNWVVTSAPLYDELGRLLDKRLHASNYDGTSAVTLSSTFSYLQSLDYTYNIRGWLTGVNDVSSCAVQGGDNLADVFSLKLDYDAPTGGGTAQYNGNISTMQWRTYIGTTCLTQQQYRFAYDYANRLTAADHYTHNGTSWTFTNNYSESGITYDFNGNIKTYTRRGQTPSASFNTIDQLTYTYGDTNRPDRLTQVADAAPLADRPKGFVPTTGTITGDHYIYDANGNMTTDNHKGFVIQYNYLNLPIVMTKGANVITTTYTADGEKLTKAVTGGGATKNYVGGIEYSGANLEAIYHGEGRCTPNGATAFFYEYTVKDHLGNARVNFRANGAAVTFLEELHYYPFGMQMEGIGTAAVTQNKYRYNGKEMNDDFGLNLSDYGARWYDASLGRWWSVDPLTEKMPRWSSYNYGFDNPLLFVDPTGMESEAYSILNKTAEYSQKYEEDMQRFTGDRSEYRGGAHKRLFKTYIYNKIPNKMSAGQLVSALNYAVDIFTKNGFEGIFTFVFLQKSDMKNLFLTGRKEFYLSIIDSQVRRPGTSNVNEYGEVFTEGNNGSSSFVNLFHASYYSPENRVFALGYLIAHELLHQLIQKATYALYGQKEAQKLLQDDESNHTDTEVNLNMSGPKLYELGSFPQGPSQNLRPAETILQKHYILILRYLFEVSLDKN